MEKALREWQDRKTDLQLNLAAGHVAGTHRSHGSGSSHRRRRARLTTGSNTMMERRIASIAQTEELP
jgi:hypothetical protein